MPPYTKQVGFIAIVTLIFSFGSLQSAPSPDLVLRHVNVIDVAGARVQADQRLLVRDGRIAAIEPEQSVAPQTAIVIDAKGKFLIPGLWDMHTHLIPGGPQSAEDIREETLPLLIANGVLGVREMGTTDVGWIVSLREEIKSGKRQGPHIVVSGTKLNWINETEARQAVRALKAAGVDFVKVYDRISKETYLAIADQARREGLPFAGHIPLGMTAREFIEAGPASIEHMGLGKLREMSYGYLPEGAAPPPDTEPQQTERLKKAINAVFAGNPSADVWGEGTRRWLNSALGKSDLALLNRELGLVESLTVLRRQPVAAGIKVAVRARHTKGERSYEFQLDRQGKIEWMIDGPDVLLPGQLQRLAELLIAKRVWVTPTLLPLNRIAIRPELLKSPDPRLVYIRPDVRRRFDPAGDVRYRDWTNDWDVMKRLYTSEAKLVPLLHKAGVRMLAGTDDVTDYCLPGFGLHDELALLVQEGLSPSEALRMATLNPAEFLGWEKESGSIAVGKKADLVLLERNPLTDIRNTTSIWGVIRTGQYLDRAQLDQMLETVRKRVNQQ
jgi:imidazolonepropionase-like amidohydrolase